MGFWNHQRVRFVRLRNKYLKLHVKHSFWCSNIVEWTLIINMCISGTGKTLSLLCSTLAWIEKERQNQWTPGKSMNKSFKLNKSRSMRSVPLVIYATRAHTQIEQGNPHISSSFIIKFKLEFWITLFWQLSKNWKEPLTIASKQQWSHRGIVCVLIQIYRKLPIRTKFTCARAE